MRDPFLLIQERFPGVSVGISKEALSTGKSRGIQGVDTIPTVPQRSQSTPEEPDFPAQPRNFTLNIDSHHGGTGDSSVGKPRGKATDPCVNEMGRLTLLLQLGRKRTCMSPHETMLDSTVDSRGTLSSM